MIIGLVTQLYVLKYNDTTRTTHSNLDVLQEKRIDDCWNVDVDQRLSDSWTECTKFTLLNDKHPKGYMWSGTRLTKIRATTGPDYLRPENVSGMSQAAQKREKQERAVEKPELDNARKLRGIYFIDPEVGEYRETIQKRTEKVGETNGSGIAL